jgi:hypothetical protein
MSNNLASMTTDPGMGGKPATSLPVLVRWRGRPVERMEPPSREAQRCAAAILEVLAGMRTPTEAALAMGTTVARYYLWEQRAVAGLVGACEPRARSTRWQITALQKEVAQLKQECARQQALVRTAQRTIGLAPPPTPKPMSKAGGKAAGKGGNRIAGKRARQRRPVVRALKAAAALRAAPVAEEAASSSSGVLPAEVLQRTPAAACGAGIPPAQPATEA